MKKNICFIVLIIVLSMKGNSQEYKRNNNWCFGYAPVVIFNFNSGFSIDTLQQINGLKSSSCISDSNGIFQFYSTGFGVVNKDGFLLENGNFINCPYGNVLANYYGGASLFDQTSIILPKKGNTYYVFCTGMSDSFANNYINQVNGAYWDVLNYSVVDMDSNNGKGKVVQKNVVLADDRRYANTAMHAVKHANGKDWWLVKADCYNNRYEEYIVREDTILGPYFQQATDSTHNEYCIGGMNQIYFNQQGTQMASGIYGTLKNGNFYFRNRVDLYDFNRCTGELTHKKYYEVPQDTATYPNYDVKNGLCFSPNDSLLYMSNRYSVYQIDLHDTNTNNATFIHGIDTTIANFPWYDAMGIAPDGKIYIGNGNGTRKYMSYIDKPNIKGLGCDFKPQGLWQPYTNLRTPPNMPNYGLGADSALLVGCEPVGNVELQMINDELVVYPNPSSSIFYIKNRKGKRKYLLNLVGEVILSTTKDEIDVSGFSKGIYFLRSEGQTKKVVVE